MKIQKEDFGLSCFWKETGKIQVLLEGNVTVTWQERSFIIYTYLFFGCRVFNIKN